MSGFNIGNINEPSMIAITLALTGRNACSERAVDLLKKILPHRSSPRKMTGFCNHNTSTQWLVTRTLPGAGHKLGTSSQRPTPRHLPWVASGR